MFISPCHMLLAVSVTATAVGFAPQAFAATQSNYFDLETIHWYGGFNVGESRLQLNITELATSFSEFDSRMSNVTYHKDDTGFKIYGGVDLSDYVALELGYFRLGQVGFNSDLNVNLPDTAAQATAQLSGHFKEQGIHLDIIAKYPFNREFAVNARLGATYNETNARLFLNMSDATASFNQNKHDMNYKYGAGMEYRLDSNWLIHLDMERYRLDDFWGDQGAFNLLSVGMVYHYN